MTCLQSSICNLQFPRRFSAPPPVSPFEPGRRANWPGWPSPSVAPPGTPFLPARSNRNMARGIVCSEGVRLEIHERGGMSQLTVTWDEETDHHITTDVSSSSLFAILNGMPYVFAAEPWTCELLLNGTQVDIAVRIDEFEIMTCGFGRDAFESALLTAFQTLRKAYRA